MAWRSALVVLLLSELSAAAAEPDSTVLTLPVYEVRAARLNARELLDRQSGFATLLEAGAWQDGISDLGSVLSRALGVQLRSRGSLGASASLGVRGSDAQQVPIYLDGVLLNDPNDGGVDLGALELSSLERMEIHRSGAPLLLGGGSLGGAIHLFSQRDVLQPRLLAGGGGYGERFVEAGGGVALPADWALSLQTRYARGEGDWLAFDDRGTQYNPNDDRWTERINNDAQTLSLFLRAHGDFAGGRLSVVEQFRRRELGDPGPLHHEPARVRYGESSQQLQLQWQRTDGRTRTLRGHHRVDLPFFEDPASEFGYPSDYHARVDQLGLGARGSLTAQGRELWRLDLRSERLQSRDDAQANSDGEAQWRHTGELALEPQWEHGPWRLVTGAQAALHHERFHSTQATNPLPTGELETHTRASHVAQLAVRRQLGSTLALKSTLAHSERLPTMVELYGARSGVLSNPDLRPERAWLADLGLIATPRRGTRLELVFFRNLYDDLISFRPISPRAVKAFNVAAARTQGLELALDCELPFGLHEALRWQLLDSEDRSEDQVARGKSLVGRPRSELTQQLGARWRGLFVEYELTAVGESYFESGERNAVPSQLLHGLRASLRWGRAQLSAHLANLSDETVYDVWRYPLPGRTLHLSLSVEGERR